MDEHGIAVFAYDFPHRKSNDVLLSAVTGGLDVRLVLGAPWRRLKTSPKTVRTKVKESFTLHPHAVADSLHIPYASIKHDDATGIAKLVNDFNIGLGLIGGARILKQPVIEAFEAGIVNLHPGVLPYARGLDALQWSIVKGVPLGATAHLIDPKVDAGLILQRSLLNVENDDTLFDLTSKLHGLQLSIIAESVEQAFLYARGEVRLEAVDTSFPNRGAIPRSEEAQTVQMLEEYKRNPPTSVDWPQLLGSATGSKHE
jgi:folate-dependent phosphoribosylglycinamide formyltransferase PurN